MNRSFPTNWIRPNLPLRKPSSTPIPNTAMPPPPLRPLSMTAGAPVQSQSGLLGEGPTNFPVRRDQSLLGPPPALTVCFCNFCGQQGNFRCKRCKKTSYCSVVCQTADWKAHRRVCKSVDQEPAKELPKETLTSQVTGERACMLEQKNNDSLSLQRVYFKDLHVTEVFKGIDIQASVLEFYSPQKFFLLPQTPELLEALQNISSELRKTYSSSSAMTYVPCVGEVCAVQFSYDLNWYRGLVQTLAPDQKSANILYIDYGNEENAPVDRIRPLAANIQPICPCAVECQIAGVVPVVGKWSDECCTAVRQMLVGKTVTVRLVETLKHGRTHAVDILLFTGKQLSIFLLENGYAQKEAVNVTPTEQDINAVVSASLENFKCLLDGKDDNSWALPPEPLTQVIGDHFSVVLTHFQSPKDFIVQKVENAGVIQDLQLKLRDHCNQVAALQNFRPAPGTVCCAQFSEDKQWYRAKVLAYSSEEHICVGYLDFGNSEVVDLGLLRPISPSLLALPIQAVPCTLAGVQPLGESWSEDCLVALQRRISSRILRLDIQGAQDGKVLVAMIDEGSDPQANIAELLISAGYATSAAVLTRSDQQTNEMAAAAAAEKHASLPVCEPLVWSRTELPCDSQTVALQVSAVENPGEFYCRISNRTNQQQLSELAAQIKLHCEAVASPFVPKVGEPCCAMFSGDGAWYRAMVKGVSEDKVAVNFADYGYNMELEKGHLRSITPKLLTLPFQAVCCWLTGVEPLGSEWSSEALLWFQTLVAGEPLSARVLSITEQGYGVELESKGQNVAAALISEQLAKVPGNMAKETHAKTGSATKQESEKEYEHSQLHDQASYQSASSKALPTEGQATISSEVLSFPEDWKTVELPLNETFQPNIAAVINPSLFYLLGPTQVDGIKLQAMMMELATYCRNNQAMLSSAEKSRPAPGAACCAQFSEDSNWYRAVILEVGQSEMNVIYADYGNCETVPFSRILPIPVHLLQLPFLITRCTITGKEHFPADWPEEVQQMFKTMLLGGVLSTVQSFNGSANVLSLTLPCESGGGHITAMLLDALHAQTKSSPSPATTQTSDTTGSSTSVSSAASPACPQPKSIPETQGELENIPGPVEMSAGSKTSEPTPQKKDTAPAANEDPAMKKNDSNTNDPQTSCCSCLSLKAKIDHLEQLMEQLMELQRSLINSLLDKQNKI